MAQPSRSKIDRRVISQAKVIRARPGLWSNPAMRILLAALALAWPAVGQPLIAPARPEAGDPAAWPRASAAARISQAGTAATETLRGTAGDDAFRGGGGADTLIGGAGDDTYYVTRSEVIVERPG